MDTNKFSKIIIGILFAGVALVMSWGALSDIASAIVTYPPGALLQPGDVTSSHIRDATIVNADLSASADIQIQKIKTGGGQGLLYFSNGTYFASSTKLSFSTTTDTLTVTGSLAVTATTTFNGVAIKFPGADGSNGQMLTTNSAGQLSWTTPAAVTTASFTADEALTASQTVRLVMTQGTDTFSENLGVNNTDALVFGDAGARTKVAQSFQASTSIAIDRIVFKVTKTGTPTDSAKISIQTNSGSAPSGTILASSTISGANWPASGNIATSTLSTTASLEANTTYWVVWERTGALDGSNYYGLYLKQTTGGYANGTYAIYNGSAWADDSGTDVQVSFWHLLGTTGLRLAAGGTNETADKFIGFAQGTASASSSATVVMNGTIGNFTGLIPGLTYYLSNTPGGISLTAGAVSKKLGKAISTTTLMIINKDW